MHLHVYNNTESPITVPFSGSGGHNSHIEFKPGVFNRCPAGPLELVTGGFTEDGKAKGGVGAYLFNKLSRIGKRMAPQLELGNPRPSDEVHDVTPVKGARSHYRTVRADQDRKERQALLAAMERVGGGDAELRAQLAEARAEAAEAKAQAAELRAQLAESQLATGRAQLAFDPNEKTVSQIGEALDGLSADELRALIEAEGAGKNRSSALAAMAEALEIVEA